MTTEPLTITADDAAELYELEDGDQHAGWTRVADQTLDSGRWIENHYLVLSNDNGLFGVPYGLGLTEYQENELPWKDDPEEPIALVPLVAEQVTRYRRVKP